VIVLQTHDTVEALAFAVADLVAGWGVVAAVDREKTAALRKRTLQYLVLVHRFPLQTLCRHYFPVLCSLPNPLYPPGYSLLFVTDSSRKEMEMGECPRRLERSSFVHAAEMVPAMIPKEMRRPGYRHVSRQSSP
jgi:hypothetical protein